MTPRASEAIEMARRAWDEAAPIHAAAVGEKLRGQFKNPDFCCLDPPHAAEFRRIDVAGKAIAQFNCNNGRELISVRRLGAGRCVGFDISSAFLEQAHHLATIARTACEFVVTDIYAIPDDWNGVFDVVFVTAGALCFMPDLDRYFSKAASLLCPDGVLTLYESNPLLDMFKMDRDRGREPLEFSYSYFDTEPILHRGGLDYHLNRTYDAAPVLYFRHTLSSIFMSVLRAAFSLENFLELPLDPSRACSSLESLPAVPPLSFILTARKARE